MSTKTGHVIDGWNASIMQLLGSGPKLTIRYGHCDKIFEKRVAPANHPIVGCQWCGGANKLNVTRRQS
jgi:hypothetical protein